MESSYSDLKEHNESKVLSYATNREGREDGVKRSCFFWGFRFLINILGIDNADDMARVRLHKVERLLTKQSRSEENFQDK